MFIFDVFVGAEALSRVPAEFVVQHAEFANPPALLLSVERLLRKLPQPGQQLRSLLDRHTLENLYVRLQTWVAWYAQFMWSATYVSCTFCGSLIQVCSLLYCTVLYCRYERTQSSSVAGMGYRWRGRDAGANHELNPKTLTSGLDDYPRASHPTDQERHLDLYCWMTLAYRVCQCVRDIRVQSRSRRAANYP